MEKLREIKGFCLSIHRIWWGTRGRFIGFYGQHRGLTFPASEQIASTPVLPYDITEVQT